MLLTNNTIFNLHIKNQSNKNTFLVVIQIFLLFISSYHFDTLSKNGKVRINVYILWLENEIGFLVF